ncbi:MAG: hypothetical protein ABI881_07705 [Betaproteobacteria bacterium]
MIAHPSRDAAVVAVIAVAYVAFGTFVGGGYDPGRDVAEAFAIVHDGARPLLGPLVAGHAQLGPAWYYLLALPMLVTPTWFAAAMAAVVVGALQFPLAYAAGKRLGDATLGVLWAAALALPGWASFETVGFASTNAVRTLVIATVYCVLRTRDTPHLGWWFAAGLAVAAATHAHPSCAWLLALVSIAAWLRPGRVATYVRDRAAALLAVLAGIALPFAPVLFASASLVDATRTVAQSNVGIGNLVRVPALLWSVAWTGPHAIIAAVFPPGLPFATNVATVAALLGIAGASRGVVAVLSRDRAARWGLLLVLVATTFVALARPVTPLYMAYSIIPGYALLVASGWRAFSRAQPRALFLFPALVAATIAGAGVVRSMQQGGGRIDTPILANITHRPSLSPVATDIWLAAGDVDPLGRALCADPMPVYGALAYALDVFYAMPLRLHCAPALPRFSDENTSMPAQGRLGLALRRYRDLGIEPAARSGGLGFDPVVRIVAAPTRRDLPTDATYPPHVYATGAATRIEYGFDAPSGEWVVVANPRVTWMPAWDIDATCNGAPISPATEDLVTRVYRCIGDVGTRRWTIGVSADDPRAIEIVTFAPRVR